MKNFFSNNWALKIISVIGAILVWMYIIVVVDPAIDITIHDIPIQYIEQGKLVSQGLSVVNEMEQTLDLKIKGSRKKLTNIDPKSITATVDLSAVTSVGTHSLPINVVIPYEYNEIIERNPYSIDVTTDKIIESRKDITIKTVGNLASNHASGEIKVTPSSVLIKGAESAIKQISGVEVTLDYNSSDEDIYSNSKITFIGKDGNAISDDDKILKSILADIDNADIYCPVYELKTVPVKPDCEGESITLRSGENANIKVSPSTVTIYAPTEILKDINEIKTEVFSVENLNIGDEFKVNIKKMDGVNIRGDANEVTIKVVDAANVS